MAETCLAAVHLALLIFGAILGTLLIAGAFFVLIWRWLRKNNDSKVFYLQRAEGPNAVDAEMGERKSQRGAASPQSRRADGEDEVDGRPTTQRSLVLRGHQPAAPANVGGLSALSELGVTIRKVQRSGFEIETIEKADCSFVVGDRLTELSVRLDQLSLEAAATLLELLVPYRIQLEVLRAQTTAEQPKAATASNEEVQPGVEMTEEKPEQEEKNEGEDEAAKESQQAAVEEEPPALPSVPPPSSPVPSERAAAPSPPSSPSPPPPPPPTTNDGGKSPSDEEATARRLATRIPTPKSARGTSRLSSERATFDADRTSDPLPPKVPQHADAGGRQFDRAINGFQYEKRESLQVSSEETDEFGLTAEQYNTLEQNRRRLQREREELRMLGIIS